LRKAPAAILTSLLFTLLFVATTFATPAQSGCAALNPAKGEGKFTGQISTAPDGSSMEVTYGDQTILVHYNNSVTVCQGGEPASLTALTRGASVSVFGPLRRNGKSMEIDAARIFVAGRPQTARPSPEPALPSAQHPQVERPSPEPAVPSAQQTQPSTAGRGAIPNSVILGGGTHAATMQRLRVVRKYEVSGLRTSSQVTLGEARLDFRPMLNNPKALFNVAQRLHEMPQHVQIHEESSEVSEVEQGLVIHHVLSYHILPGKCGDSGARAQLSGAGIECFTRAAAGDRVAEFSRPGAPHYVADPVKRQAAISALQRNSALADADANKGIADLRKTLANPTQRAAIAPRLAKPRPRAWGPSPTINSKRR